MICTRCGTEQRRETARFCHVCGAPIEPVTASAQPNNAGVATAATPAQPAHGLRPISLTPPEPAINSLPESSQAPEIQQASPYPDETREPATSWNDENEPTVVSSQPFTADPQAFSSNRPSEWDRQASDWQQESPIVTPNQPSSWRPMSDWQEAAPASTPLAWADQAPRAYAAAPEEKDYLPSQEDYQTRVAQSRPPSRPESLAWPEIMRTDEPQPEQAPAQDMRRDGWNSAPPAYRSEQSMAPEAPLQESEREGREHPFPAAQHRPRSMANDPFGDAGVRSAGRASPASERPTRSTAGPVQGSLTRRRPVKRRKVPLGVTVTIGLLLLFILGGIGVYAVMSSAGGQEPSAFVNYTDPHHHFTIEYPTVWNYKHVDNGVRFADATNTAELSITYVPNTSNLTAQQFADQEAQKQNLNTPDTRTFAGQTWVVRSGIVTQKSGIAQDIFIFVTVYNNFIYEIQEVTPLDGYQQPNQVAFLPMLQKYLKLS